MKAIKKKEILQVVEKAMEGTLEKLHISKPSKKTKKILNKAAKKVSRRLRSEVKVQTRKTNSVKAKGNGKHSRVAEANHVEANA